MDFLTKLRNVARRPQPVRYVVGELLVRSRLCRFLTIRRRSYRLRFWPSHLSMVMWVEGPEKYGEDEEILRAIVRLGDTVVDVGANVGALTLTAAVLVGDSGRVLAIEPHPETFKYLSGNVALNGFTNVELRQCAVGEVHGTVEFCESKFDDINHVAAPGERGRPVPLLPLDDLTAGLSEIRLLKIDVEGFEPEVLAGAGDTLARTSVVMIEWAPVNLARFGHAGEDLLAPLTAAGFSLLRERRASWVPVSATEPPAHYTNILAVREPVPHLDRLSIAV